MHLPWRFRGRLIMGAVVVVALAAGAAAYASIATRGTHVTASVTPATAVHAGMKSGQVTGHRVTGQTYAKAPAPTAAQLKAVMSASKEETAPAPNRVTTNAGPTGPAVAAPNSPRAADSDYKRFLFRALPVSSIVGGSGYSSFTNEPSVAKAGKDIFMTGNWYAGYSHNHTGSWTFLNPFTIFGSGFCCDQVTIYDKTHDRVYWLLQYGNHLTVANSSSNNLASWCSYNFYSTTIGQASTTALDFNDVMVGTRNLYFTTNIFPTSGGYGSEIVRLPLEQMSTCSSVGFNYYSQLDSFTWRLVQGSDDRAYWGSDWDPTGARPNGSSFRVFWWDENSGTIHWNNYNISPVRRLPRAGRLPGERPHRVLHERQTGRRVPVPIHGAVLLPRVEPRVPEPHEPLGELGGAPVPVDGSELEGPRRWDILVGRRNLDHALLPGNGHPHRGRRHAQPAVDERLRPVRRRQHVHLRRAVPLG